MICTINSSTGPINASDRNKYVGSTFYEALLKFPVINRKISHWLSEQIEFSDLALEISNVDARFNSLELGGADYTGFIGKTITVAVGLRDVASTYTNIFSGAVTEIGGSGRTVKSLTFTARDQFDKTNQNLPLTALTTDVFPDLEPEKVGLAVPVVYGNWTEALRKDVYGVEQASIPAFCVNGLAAQANTALTAKFIISENDNTSFDPANVYIFRGGLFTRFDTSDIVGVTTDNRFFEIKQNAVTVILPPPGTDGAGDQWIYQNGDVILVRVMGKDLSPSISTNAVAIARDIAITYGGFSSGDFDSNWATFEAKTTPPQSAIASIKARVWVQEVQDALQYSLSLLAQVRLEAFISREQKVKLNSQHFEEFDASSSFEIKNWDIVKDSFAPAIDTQNNFNRARALYDKDPVTNQTGFATGFYNNGDAISQVGKQITKDITYPNLYVASDVENQLIETLRLASAGSELVAVQLTSRSFLRDLGDWVKVSVKIGSTVFDNVPAQIREIGYDPAGLKLPAVLWSMQAVPFPGYTPGYAGIVGGFSATITAE